MKSTARGRKAPLPQAPAIGGDLAAIVLRHVIDTGDYIGAAHIDLRGRSHFIMIELPDSTFRQLCQHEAEQEDAEESDGLQHDDCDDEDNGDDEPAHDDEPSNVTPCDFRLLNAPVSPLFPKVRQ